MISSKLMFKGGWPSLMSYESFPSLYYLDQSLFIGIEVLEFHCMSVYYKGKAMEKNFQALD